MAKRKQQTAVSPSTQQKRPLTRFEIKQRAADFAQKWEGEQGIRPEKEESHKQTWWNELFGVFGVQRSAVATFEESIENLKGNSSSVDLLYKGVLIAEQKSRGKDLDVAFKQALNYNHLMGAAGKAHECARYIVVSDFERIRVYDLHADSESDPFADFLTSDLPKHIDSLMFIQGGAASEAKEEEAVDIQAAELLGKLHDALEDGGYKGHRLERFLVRCLFCLFADDTDIFETNDFHEIVKSSREDGTDLGAYLGQAFAVLNTPTILSDDGRRIRDPMPSSLWANLPYVNGDLFLENLEFAAFTKEMRDALLRCCEFDWSKISPAIFGSLFQSVMESRDRRQIGAHYTSEADILKLIRPLFLDDLERELVDCGESATRLRAFHDKIASLKFLDPACGCGNFLIVAYKELRRLEHEILKRLALKAKDRGFHGIGIDPTLLQVSPRQMHGIEISEWAARIAEVALILAERQMDLSIVHSISFTRLPLQKGATIHVGNALQTDWNTVLPASECSYVLGNPPFVGAMLMSADQREDLLDAAELVGAEGAGVLDYVSGWYFKAAQFIRGTVIRVAFVSTSSISQGEQVGLLWDPLISLGVKIHFAYRTFTWESEARGKAHVHVVIVGLGCTDPKVRVIYEFNEDAKTWDSSVVSNISPYLFEGASVTLKNRSTPLCPVRPMAWGSQPRDGGHLLLSREERDDLLAAEPDAVKWIRPFLGAEEFINGAERFCLWLVGIEPAELRALPKVVERVEAVRKMRQSSKAEATRKLAARASLFAQIAHTDRAYLLVPRHTAHRRKIVPMGFPTKATVAGDACQIIPDADLFLFGTLTSSMHMAWLRQFCGRIKSDFRYSKDIVYNNYPFPTAATEDQRQSVEDAAQRVLDCRKDFLSKGATLADLYDPRTMPPALVKAHEVLDRAVERCYRKEPFKSDRERVEFLFARYQELADPLTGGASVAAVAKKGRGRTKKPKI